MGKEKSGVNYFQGKIEEIKKDIALIRRGLGLVSEFTPRYLLHSFLRAAEDALSPFIGLYFGALILDEGASPDRDLRHMLLMVLYMCAGMFLLEFAKIFSDKRINVNAEISAAWEEIALNTKSFDLDYMDLENPALRDTRESFFSNREYAGLAYLMWSLNYLMQSVFQVVVAAVMLAGLFTLRSPLPLHGALAVFDSPWMAAAMAALLAASTVYLTIAIRRNSQKRHELYKDMPKEERTLHYYLNEYLDDSKAGKDLRIYGQQNIIVKSSREIFEKYTKLRQKLSLLWLGEEYRTSMTEAAMQGIVFLWVAMRALGGAFGVGSVVKYIGLMERLIGGVTACVGNLEWLRSNNKLLSDLFDYLDRPTLMQKEGRPVDRSIERHEIAFCDVSFRYPGQEDFALRNLSLKFQAGERMAVVGRNGSGKTTMIKLLCRLYEPTEGKITLDGTDIRELDYAQYQALFSVVFQDFRLFSFGLGQNVAANDSYDEAKATDCIEKAGLGERLQGFADGLGTAIYKDFDENGVEISGGEAQKIAIARALYKDAPFMILDEPTAALDPLAEYEIYSRFDEIVGCKTAVYISHRLSSCRFCDRIVVFEQGSLVQSGSHEALLAEEGGIYASLWNAQAKYYEEQALAEGKFREELHS